MFPNYSGNPPSAADELCVFISYPGSCCWFLYIFLSPTLGRCQTIVLETIVLGHMKCTKFDLNTRISLNFNLLRLLYLYISKSKLLMEFVYCRKYQQSPERIFQPLPSSKCSLPPKKHTSHVVSVTGRQSYLDDWGAPFARVYPLCAHPLWRDAPNWALFRRWILKIYCEIALERRSGHHVSATGFVCAGVAVYLCFNKTSFNICLPILCVWVSSYQVRWGCSLSLAIF